MNELLYINNNLSLEIPRLRFVGNFFYSVRMLLFNCACGNAARYLTLEDDVHHEYRDNRNEQRRRIRTRFCPVLHFPPHHANLNGKCVSMLRVVNEDRSGQCIHSICSVR